MHTYSTDNDLRPTIIAVLGLGSYFIARIIGSFVGEINQILPLGIEFSAPATLLVFTLVYLTFDKWLWDLSILRLLNIVKTPNLEGEWSGTLQSSYDSGQSNSSTDIELHIHQSWRKISVELDASDSSSRSLGATILSQRGQGKPELIYYYRSEPDWDAPDTMNIHYGTATLTVHEDGSEQDILKGNYYNSHERDSHGQMELVRNENNQSWLQRRIC